MRSWTADMTRKILTIGSLTGFVACIVLWALCALNIQWILDDQVTQLDLRIGSVWISQWDDSHPQNSRFYSWYVSNPGFKGLPRVSWTRFPTPPLTPHTWVILPLWMPTLLFALYPAFLAVLSLRRRRRKRRGLCVCCGYALKGLTEPRCPECNAPFELPASSHA